MGLALVALAVARCGEQEEQPGFRDEPGFRIVPSAGRIWISTELGTVTTGGAAEMVPASGEMQISVCAVDHDGFPVARNTAVWVQTSAGWLSVVDGVERLDRGRKVGCGGGSGTAEPTTDSPAEGASDAGDTDTDVEEELPAYRPSTLVVASDQADGCALVALHAPVYADTITLTAWSGDVTGQSLTVEVVQVPKSLTATLVPAVLGPDGGAVTVLAHLLDERGEPIAGETVRASTTHGVFSSPTDPMTNDAGVASFALTVTQDATVSLQVDAEFASVPASVPIALAPPRITSIDGQPYAWSLAAPPATPTTVIRGTGFSATPTVTFGATSVSVTVRSSEELEVTVPAPNSVVACGSTPPPVVTGAPDTDPADDSDQDTDPEPEPPAEEAAAESQCVEVVVKNPSGLVSNEGDGSATTLFQYEVTP